MKLHDFFRKSASVILAAVISGCTADSKESAVSLHQMMELNAKLPQTVCDDDYRTTYEVFLYSFCDSDGDGIGDINGLISKLDYIEDMGFNSIWLMPVHPSGTYHKYDVDDYYAVDPAYGTMEDFERLTELCEEKNINVIMDLVLNHTSTKHEWFVNACDAVVRGYESPYVDYYHFTDEKKGGYAKLNDADVYYECQFWDQMPDLNLDNENVRKEILDIISFWQDKGVDGFRLDAVTSYYTGQDSKNIAFLKWLKENTDTYFVAEAWTTQETYASYYQSGLDSFFDFAFADAKGLISSVVNGSYGAEDYGNAQVKEQELYASYNPDYVNAPFYTNHDMGRGAGYYAGDDGRKTKLALGLNLLMSGNAFVYYGEELGMKGSGIDENKRAPMYWSKDPEAEGMCRGPENMQDFEMKFDSLQEQKDDPYSIWQYVRQAVHVRNAFDAMRKGKVTLLDDLSDEEVCVYLKNAGDQEIAVAVNVTEQSETVELGSLAGKELKAVLLTGEEEVVVQDGSITLPPYAIAILE